MGIDVSDARVVTFNPDHERRVDTNVARLPPRQTLGTIEVVSIFARKTVATDDLDGNPLIYALKGKFGYTMPYGSFRQIYRRAAEILPKALDGIDFDMIVPLPSSSAVTAIVAERASRCGGDCAILPCLEKATFAQVLQAAPPINMVEKRYRRNYGRQLSELQKASPAATFEMKKVKSPLRGYFLPVVAGPGAEMVAGHRILLVDDILGSGTSIMAAARALNAFEPVSIAGLTLMGKLA
jgi:hypothetical protein